MTNDQLSIVVSYAINFVVTLLHNRIVSGSMLRKNLKEPGLMNMVDGAQIHSHNHKQMILRGEGIFDQYI